MRIRAKENPFICRKIVQDLAASGLVRLVAPAAECERICAQVLEAEQAKEARLDARVDELLAEKEADIELMQADEKSLFWMSKAHLAEEFGVIMNLEERHFAFAAAMTAALVEADAVAFNVGELRVRNVIFRAIEAYLRLYEELDERVWQSIKNHKRRLVPGSEEYEIVYQKLYLEELAKHGLA